MDFVPLFTNSTQINDSIMNSLEWEEVYLDNNKSQIKIESPKKWSKNSVEKIYYDFLNKSFKENLINIKKNIEKDDLINDFILYKYLENIDLKKDSIKDLFSFICFLWAFSGYKKGYFDDNEDKNKQIEIFFNEVFYFLYNQIIIVNLNDSLNNKIKRKEDCFFTDEILSSNLYKNIPLNNIENNLISINLVSFYQNNKIDTNKFMHVIELCTFILDIINKKGLGLANAGTLLKRMNFPLLSIEGYVFIASLFSILTAYSYKTSAKLASFLDVTAEYRNNRKEVLEFIKNHRCAAYGLKNKNLNKKERNDIVKKVGDYKNLKTLLVPLEEKEYNLKITKDLIDLSKKVWDEALSIGGSFGYRNKGFVNFELLETIALILGFDNFKEYSEILNNNINKKYVLNLNLTSNNK